MFQFPGFLSLNLFFQLRMTRSFLRAGFPHSDICGSLLPYSSPQRFAVWCVLLQLQVARHSPYALICLIYFFSCFCFTLKFELEFLFNFFLLVFLFNFSERHFFSVMSFPVIQFSKTSERFLSLPKLNRKSSALHSFSLERR